MLRVVCVLFLISVSEGSSFVVGVYLAFVRVFSRVSVLKVLSFHGEHFMCFKKLRFFLR